MRKVYGVLMCVNNKDLNLLKTNPKVFWSDVRTIGKHAFYDCRDLTSITIPASVRWIEDYAFEGPRGLTSITILGSETYIRADDVFKGCTGLKEIEVDADNKYFSSEDGVLYNKEKTELICCPKGKTSITIPYSVTKIGERAFEGCTGLTSITIPNSVTKIGYSAFKGCTGLKEIEVDADNKYYSSEDGVLYNKEKTELICCPKGKTSITIPYSVTKIGERAFEGCTGLTSITIPNSVTKIGYSAFKGCTGLKEIEVDADNKYYSSEDGVLYNKEKTELICCPKGKTSITIPYSVTKIGEEAFWGCKSLTSITIPSSVTKIGKRAFAGFTGLTSITIPNSVTKIGEEAFWGCKSLTSITIPSSVTEIGFFAFEGCKSLTSITIPEGVIEIGCNAFERCTGLTSITISDSVTEIRAYAFRYCTGVKEIIMSERLALDSYIPEDLTEKLIEVETKKIKSDDYYINLTKKSLMTIHLFPVEKFSEDFVLKLKKAVHEHLRKAFKKVNIEDKTQCNAISQKLEKIRAIIDSKQELYKKQKEAQIKQAQEDLEKEKRKRFDENDDDDGKAE